MMSTQGMEVLSELYNKFRENWIEYHPGCNENDVEREFLYSVWFGLNESCLDYVPESLKEKIEKIR